MCEARALRLRIPEEGRWLLPRQRRGITATNQQDLLLIKPHGGSDRQAYTRNECLRLRIPEGGRSRTPVRPHGGSDRSRTCSPFRGNRFRGGLLTIRITSNYGQALGPKTQSVALLYTKQQRAPSKGSPSWFGMVCALIDKKRLYLSKISLAIVVWFCGWLFGCLFRWLCQDRTTGVLRCHLLARQVFGGFSQAAIQPLKHHAL